MYRYRYFSDATLRTSIDLQRVPTYPIKLILLSLSYSFPFTSSSLHFLHTSSLLPPLAFLLSPPSLPSAPLSFSIE